MARGLTERPIRLLVNGSLDTKSNPKLVQPGALLALTNMYQLRTGETRPRSGFSRQAAAFSITSGDNLFVTASGGIGTVARGWSGGAVPYAQALRYGNSNTTGWSTNGGNIGAPYPAYSALVSGILPAVGTTLGPPPDTVDPDLCIAGGWSTATWTDGTTTLVEGDHRELVTGRQYSTSFALPAIGAGRVLKTAVAGTRVAIFGSSGTNIVAKTWISGTSTGGGSHTPVTDLDAALPWFDAKAIPGTSTFAIAWKVTAAGGIKCAIYDPATGAVTSTVTTAGGDASFCLGWLDDQFSTASVYLATAGSTAGVVVRTMSKTTMVVSATNVIDAAATASIRNITGHLVNAVPDYSVFWDVSGASLVYDKINKGQWIGGAAFGGNPTAHHSLYSRSAKFQDGLYYMVGCLSSTVQPTFALISCDSQFGSNRQPAQCHVLSGEAGPRRTPCSLSTPVVNGSTVVVSLVRSRKVANPTGGSSSQVRVASTATFSQIAKLTHARELGGTVFLPGGIVQRDDGTITTAATFPIYPEAATGASAVGGAMTAGGNYLYRIVFRGVDATGRTYRSAGSIPFSVTLGAGDGTVNLTLMNLMMWPGDFLVGTPGYGAVWSEIYRRGPAAAGATLYNKVGEVAMTFVGAPNTVAFADTMSDATAANGEAAYFNGNVLENFHPPATRLLEVNGNRVGLVNAEDPSEFWYSKEYKAGTGIGFNPQFKVAISGDGAGGMTALAAMDGRWILFKRTAIYVLSGDGPNDLGQGSFNAPQAVSRSLGTTNPSSVIETPDGVMFQAPDGRFWLLDRGLGLTFIGAPIEGDSLGTAAVGAALSSDLTTVRFVVGNGLMFEWDYYHKRWYEHQLDRGQSQGSSVVDCANSALFGWCYLLDDGSLLKEISGQAFDVSADGTHGVIPVVEFPHIQLAGLAGYQRLKYIDFTVDVLGACTVSVNADYDFGGFVGAAKTFALTTGTVQFQYTPLEGKAKCTSVAPLITVVGNPTTGTFRLTGATAVIGVKRGSTATASDRMT